MDFHIVRASTVAYMTCTTTKGRCYLAVITSFSKTKNTDSYISILAGTGSKNARIMTNGAMLFIIIDTISTRVMAGG